MAGHLGSKQRVQQVARQRCFGQRRGFPLRLGLGGRNHGPGILRFPRGLDHPQTAATRGDQRKAGEDQEPPAACHRCEFRHFKEPTNRLETNKSVPFPVLECLGVCIRQPCLRYF